jgi:DNA-binding response OmpR family regulator
LDEEVDMYSFEASLIEHPNDRSWDVFVRSLYAVWEVDPEFTLECRFSLANRRAMLIDSDLSRRLNLKRLLDSTAMISSTFESVEPVEANPLESRVELAIIVVDSSMAMSPIERFCERLADRADSPVIIILFDEITPDAIRKWRRLGAGYCLRMPIDPYALLTLITASLRRTATDSLD